MRTMSLCSCRRIVFGWSPCFTSRCMSSFLRRISKECFPNDAQSSSNKSWFAKVEMGPPDPILGLTEAYKKDKNPKKVNVGVGAYRGDNGKPFVLPSVRKAEKRILSRKLNKEYLPIIGLDSFNKSAVRLALGKNSASIKEKRNVTTQSLSGTGALCLGAALLATQYGGPKIVALPNPTWGNHLTIFKQNNIKIKRYRYYDPKKIALDFKGMKEDLCQLPKGTVVLFHECAHNPTGIDPSCEQWMELSSLVRDKRLFPFFDMAYQGFASGDIDNDAFAVRLFEGDGHNLILAQSFAKNMGLYGLRIGAFTVICSSKDEADRVMSQVKILIRGMYSSPPLHGARIVSEILNDKKLKSTWTNDVKAMANRIHCVRQQLVKELKAVGSKKNWNHILQQIGMFCYSGLTPKQVNKITKKYSIYMTRDGRISMAGVTSKNAKYLAKAIHKVTSK